MTDEDNGAPADQQRAADDARISEEWTAVVRALDAVQQTFGVALDSLGLTLPYFQVLTVLFEAEDHRLPMSRIARDLAMTSGGFTKLADRMARDGLIDRRGSAGDRRVVFAALTPAGREQAQLAVEAYRGYLRDRVLRVITRAELSTMSQIAVRLDRIRTDQDPDNAVFELSQRHTDEPDRRSGDRGSRSR